MNDLRHEILALFDSLGCSYTEDDGIGYVIGPDDRLWELVIHPIDEILRREQAAKIRKEIEAK